MKSEIVSERRLKEILCDYPDLLDSDYAISMAEARDIYQRESFPGVEELIADAKARYDLPHIAWLPFEQAIERHKQGHLRMPKPGKPRTDGWFTRHRRLVAAAILLLLLTAFFTLVPVGRTLAKEIGRFLVEIFENRITVRVNAAACNGSIDSEPVSILEIESFEELDGHGIKAFQLKADWLTVESIAYQENEYYKTLMSSYSTADGQAVSVKQTWEFPIRINFLTNAEKFKKVTLSEGRVAYVSIDEEDRLTEAYLVGEEWILTISVQDRLLLGRVLETIR